MLETSNSSISLTPQRSAKKMCLTSLAKHDYLTLASVRGSEERWMPLFILLFDTGICEVMPEVIKSQISDVVAVYGQDVNPWISHIKDGFYYVAIEEGKVIFDTQMSRKKRVFRHLVEQWERERPQGADVFEMVMHPSYQRIIGMGPDIVPFLLEELERKPGHWFWALHAITGANPVPAESEGNLKDMATAWIDWGKKQGYTW